MLNRFAFATMAIAVLVALVAEPGPSSSPRTAVAEPRPKHASTQVTLPDFAPDAPIAPEASKALPAVTTQQAIQATAIEESRRRAGSSDKNGD